MSRVVLISLLLLLYAGAADAQDEASLPPTGPIEDAVVSIPDLLPEAARPVIVGLLDELRRIEHAYAAGELDIARVNAEQNHVLAESISVLDNIVGDDLVGRAAVALIGVRIAEDLESPLLAAEFLRRVSDDASNFPTYLRAQLELDGLRTGRKIARTGENIREARALIRPATVSIRQTPTLRSFGHYIMGLIADDRTSALASFDRAYLEASDGNSPRQAWLAAMAAIPIADAASIDLWASRLAVAVQQEDDRDISAFMVMIASGQLTALLAREDVQNLFGPLVEHDLDRFADTIRSDIVVGSLAGTYFGAVAMSSGWYDGAELLLASAEASINDHRWENATGEERSEHLALIERLRETNAEMRRGETPPVPRIPIVCSVKIGEAVLTGSIKLQMKFNFTDEDNDELLLEWASEPIY